MKTRKHLIGFALIVLVGMGVWFGWRWYTTPAPPTISLEGVSKERAEKVEQAIQEVRRNPRSGKTWGDLGMTLIANGFMERSIPCFAQAHRFDPSEPRWPYFQGAMLLMFGQPDGFAKLRQALEVTRSPTDRSAILFPLAQALVEDGQLDEAEQRAGELRDLEGDSPNIDFILGLLALSRNDRATARKHLSKLTDHPSARKRACALLAGLIDGNERLAQDHRRRARELPDDQPWPNSFESEVVNYRADSTMRMAPYLDLQAQGRHEEALSVLREIVEQSPDEACCFALGFALFTRNQFEQAVKAFRQVVSFNPRNARAHLFMGIALLQMGEKCSQEPEGKAKATELFQQAIAAEDRALGIQHDIADAHLARGRALKFLGRTKEAIAALRQATVVGTEYAEMHQALGETLAEAGHLSEGLGHLETAVRLAKPNDKRPRQALEKWKGKAKDKP